MRRTGFPACCAASRITRRMVCRTFSCTKSVLWAFAAREGDRKPKERRKLACVLAGAMNDKGWNTDPRAFDLDGKGAFEAIARELALAEGSLQRFPPRPSFAARSRGRDAFWWRRDWLGRVASAGDCRLRCRRPRGGAFELDMAALERTRPARDYVDVPQFPGVERDAAFVVDEAVTCEKIMQCMQSAGGKLLESVHLFDVSRRRARGRRQEVDGVLADVSRRRPHAYERRGR